MAKLPWMQFYPLDWIQDTIGLSPHARAAWIDIICFLWNHKTRGESTRTLHVWAQLVRMSPEAFSDVLLEFIDQDTCNVRIVGDGTIDADDSDRFNSDDKVTISSRRMVREETVRKSHRLSQQRYQSKKHTDTQMIKNDRGADSDLIQSDPEKLEVRSQKSEVREEKKEKIYVGLTPDGANGSTSVSLWKEAEDLLGFLNSKTGKHFQPRHPNHEPTKALQAIHRLLSKKSYSVMTIRQVIANRWLKWGNDDKMQEFLRPETLFRISKFENYVGELGKGQADASL